MYCWAPLQQAQGSGTGSVSQAGGDFCPPWLLPACLCPEPALWMRGETQIPPADTEGCPQSSALGRRRLHTRARGGEESCSPSPGTEHGWRACAAAKPGQSKASRGRCAAGTGLCPSPIPREQSQLRSLLHQAWSSLSATFTAGSRWFPAQQSRLLLRSDNLLCTLSAQI